MSNILHHSAKGRKYLIVQVEKKDYVFYIDDNGIFWSCCKNSKGDDKCTPIVTDVFHNYKILFVAEQATEVQAGQVVKYYGGALLSGRHAYHFENYDDWQSMCKTAQESLHSLIRHNFPNHAEFNHIVLLEN